MTVTIQLYCCVQLLVRRSLFCLVVNSNFATARVYALKKAHMHAHLRVCVWCV